MVDQTERPKFSNVSNKIPLSIDDMLKHLSKITNGFPLCISEQLCFRDESKIVPIKSPAALFAQIDRYAQVDWQRGGVTKEEFYEGLRQQAPKYDWACDSPHFPKIPNVYYTCSFPKAKRTHALDDLLDRLKPATPIDRQLIEASVMTLFWGGPPGKRPGFVITTKLGDDAKKGVGTGKTTLVEILGKLVGGYVSVRTSTNHDRVISGFLSPSAWSYRISLLDNLKTYRFSNDLIESLITCEEINGHRLNCGHATRPNLLTMFVTVNGAAFSKDMADRFVTIQLKRPKTDGNWYAETVNFIEQNREDIIADIRWRLEQPTTTLEKPDRWQPWGTEVLSRLENPNVILAELCKRRVEIDEDDQDAADAMQHIHACLKAQCTNLCVDTSVIYIPSPMMTIWVRKLKPTLSDRQAAQYAHQLRSSHLHPCRNKSGRFYLWRGPNAKLTTKETYLQYKVEL
jgi:hypothetical protein